MNVLLEVTDLSLNYGAAAALAGVSLEIRQGEMVALIGANGAGKSSFIRAIAGIERPITGSIAFAGRDIAALESHQICDLGIGQVAEGRQVFPTLTVAENLDTGAMLARAKAQRAANLDRVLGLFPRL
ncbi:MAG: ATP-binding cassette domain-containing protein, partial [Candidatus Binatia bacterium]